MKIALTEQFLEDKSNLPGGLERKCRELLSSLRKIAAKSIQEKALPGWRLHKLNSSPFISLSLDMNYRVVLENSNKPYAACGMSLAFLLLPSGGSRVAGGLPLGRP